MKRLQYLSIFLLTVGAVSCSKEGLTGTERGHCLEIIPSADSGSTKGAVGSGPLDGSYTIFLSSYFNNMTAAESSCNYFCGRPFKKDGDRWSATPTIWWPMGGNLDFLSFALKDRTLGSSAIWYSENVTKGVELKVPDGACLDSEIMYSRASSRKVEEGTVSLDFSHSQAWVRFEFARYEPGTIRVDSLVVKKAYLGGTLRLENGVYLKAQWDFHGFFRKDYTVPGSRDLLLSNPPTCIDLLLPEQQACDLEIWYTQRSSASAPWGAGSCHVVTANVDPWHAGTKTTYTMIIRKKLEISTSVSAWDEEPRPISIN